MKLSAKQGAEHALASYKSHVQAHAPHGEKTVCRWVPPDQGSLKLNVDGAVFATQKTVGVGAVLRGEKGGVIFSTCKKEHEINDPIEIELLASHFARSAVVYTSWDLTTCYRE